MALKRGIPSDGIEKKANKWDVSSAELKVNIFDISFCIADDKGVFVNKSQSRSQKYLAQTSNGWKSTKASLFESLRTVIRPYILCLFSIQFILFSFDNGVLVISVPLLCRKNSFRKR